MHAASGTGTTTRYWYVNLVVVGIHPVLTLEAGIAVNRHVLGRAKRPYLVQSAHVTRIRTQFPT